jgi:hypothetical protein
MKRLIWLALFCLAAIGSLCAVRVILGMGANARAAPPTAIVPDPTPPLAKGDRLPLRLPELSLPRTPVETTKIAPVERSDRSTAPAVEGSEVAKEDVVMWHWHEGAKITRRRRAQ